MSRDSEGTPDALIFQRWKLSMHWVTLGLILLESGILCTVVEI